MFYDRAELSIRHAHFDHFILFDLTDASDQTPIRGTRHDRVASRQDLERTQRHQAFSQPRDFFRFERETVSGRGHEPPTPLVRALALGLESARGGDEEQARLEIGD